MFNNLFRKQPYKPLSESITPEDLQVLSKALSEKPEYFRFLISLRDDRRRLLEKIPRPRSQDELGSYGLACVGISSEIKALTLLIEMPIKALKTINKLKPKEKSETHRPEDLDQDPWDVPAFPD